MWEIRDENLTKFHIFFILLAFHPKFPPKLAIIVVGPLSSEIPMSLPVSTS